MSFLGVAFLFAIPLAAAPLILHLLDRRRNVAIQWGAMEFLIAASARKSSTRRLKQWALLLLRMLAIAALIFALARPMIPSGWIGGTEQGETIFVVDNSMSTSRIIGDRTTMQRIIDRAEAELAEGRVGDRIRVLTTAPYPIWIANGGVRAGGIRIAPNTMGTLAGQFQAIEPTLGGSDLLAGLMTAVQADTLPTPQRRRIVLLTDGQAADWQMGDSEGWEQFRAMLSKQTIMTELEIIDIAQQADSLPMESDARTSKGNVAVGNVAVDKVRLRRERVGVNEVILATATVHNHHDSLPAESTTIIWEVDGREVATGIVDQLDPLGASEISWSHSFDQPGEHRITARMESKDTMPADDHASVVVQIVREIPVLIVESQWELSDTQQDAFFVRAALGWLDESTQEGYSIYKPRIVQDKRLGTVDLSLYHAVVVPSLRSLKRSSLESLRGFVYDGGGLWVGLGARTDIDEFNSQWFAGGSGLSPLSIDRIIGEASLGSERPPLRINPFGSEHPAVAQVADNQQSDLGAVVVDRRIRFTVAETNEQPSVLLTLSNGDPLAVEKLVGRGRVIVQSIPLRMQWSDLTRSQSFVMMVHDWIDYLAQPRSTRFNLQPGDSIVYRGDATDDLLSGMLTTPRNDAIELASDGFGDPILRTNRTSLPGSYTLETSVAGDGIPFEVARDVRESDLTTLSPLEQRQLAELSGIESMAADDSATPSGPTDPLWPYLLLGLIGLVTTELLLSGVLARERFGAGGLSQSDSEAKGIVSLPETHFPTLNVPPSTTGNSSTSRDASKKTASSIRSENREQGGVSA